MPKTKYFDHIEDLLRNINKFRENPSLLKSALETEFDRRDVNMAWNNMPNNTYKCWDDWDQLTDGQCDHIGLWKHGSDFEDTVLDWADNLDAVSPLKWSDELGLSAQRIMEQLDGCSTMLHQIPTKQFREKYISEIATYDYYYRFDVYPQRFNWKDA
jgi:hypothetical protein